MLTVKLLIALFDPFDLETLRCADCVVVNHHVELLIVTDNEEEIPITNEMFPQELSTFSGIRRGIHCR